MQQLLVRSTGQMLQDMNVDLPTSNNPQAGSSSGNLKPPTVATASGGHSQAGSGKADVSGGAHMDIDKGEAASREAVVALPNGNGLTVKVKADDKVDGVGIFPAVERLKSRCAAAVEAKHVLLMSTAFELV